MGQFNFAHMKITRRSFFGRSGWLTGASLGLPAVNWAQAAGESAAGKMPRHIIHFVADGTSMATITCADQLSNLLRERGLVWLELAQRRDAALAWVNMRSLNSLVTDSAAAASSWGSGSRVVNGMLNILPDGRKLKSLYELAGQAGWRCGLVTTTEITHATPSGFAINAKRDDSEAIAAQYLVREVEVLLGGGRKFFEAANRKDNRNLIREFAAKNYVFLQTQADLLQAPSDRKWLGLFDISHLPYTIDHVNDPEDFATIPSLAQMTRLALDRLRGSSHFILQVEGGRIDHAAHNCDAAAAFREVIAFDEAIEIGLNFQRQEPDTLLVITVDHGTGNPALNGMGTEYRQSPRLFAGLMDAKCSFPALQAMIPKAASPARIREIIEEAYECRIPLEKIVALARFLDKKGQTLFDLMNTVTAQLGQLLGNYHGIGWASGVHTSDYVPLMALGPGAERFRGFLQNTEVFYHYLALAEIDYRNPSAALLAEGAPAADDVEKSAAYNSFAWA